VAFLPRAYSQGFRYDVHLHRDPALQSLQGDAPCQELLKPKG
jgi:hypothetical protein